MIMTLGRCYEVLAMYEPELAQMARDDQPDPTIHIGQMRCRPESERDA